MGEKVLDLRKNENGEKGMCHIEGEKREEEEGNT